MFPDTSFFRYAHHLLDGAGETVQALAIITVMGLAFGALGAAARLSPYKSIKFLSRAYIHFFRGIPEMVIVLGSYFGLSAFIAAVFPNSTFQLSPFWAGAIALSLTFGAYATEIFRAAYFAVPKGELEAGVALGMRKSLIIRHLLVPQAMRYALPGLGNLILVMLKDTALLSVIGVTELMRETKVAIGYTGKPFTFYLGAAIIYLCLTLITLKILRFLEKRTLHGINAKEIVHDF